MHVLPLNIARSNHHTTGDGPSAADLDHVECEMPLIAAEVELLDARIAVLDRTPSELDTRRLRRAHRRVLTARRALANRTTDTAEVA